MTTNNINHHQISSPFDIQPISLDHQQHPFKPTHKNTPAFTSNTHTKINTVNDRYSPNKHQYLQK